MYMCVCALNYIYIYTSRKTYQQLVFCCMCSVISYLPGWLLTCVHFLVVVIMYLGNYSRASLFFCVRLVMPSTIHSSIHHLFLHSFIPSFIHSFLHSFIPSFIHSFLHSFIHSFIHSFLHSFIPSFLHSFIHSFIHSFSPSFLYSFIPSFIHSFLPSFIHSFIHACSPSLFVVLPTFTYDRPARVTISVGSFR